MPGLPKAVAEGAMVGGGELLGDSLTPDPAEQQSNSAPNFLGYYLPNGDFVKLRELSEGDPGWDPNAPALRPGANVVEH
jgi:hypothetical protein